MTNFDVVGLRAPVAGEEIGDEAAMALLRARLGTKKRDTWRPQRRVQACRDAALFHHREKICFIRRPIFRAAIILEKFRRRSKKGIMEILDSGDFFQKEREVRVLGETRKLPAAVLADVDDLADAGIREQSEKLFCGLSGEADGAEEPVHNFQKYSAASGEARKAKSFDWSARASRRAASRPATKSEVLVTSSKPWRTSRRSSASLWDSSAPPRRMCTGLLPCSISAGQIIRKRWHCSGSSSAHIKAMTLILKRASARSIPAAKSGARRRAA